MYGLKLHYVLGCWVERLPTPVCVQRWVILSIVNDFYSGKIASDRKIPENGQKGIGSAAAWSKNRARGRAHLANRVPASTYDKCNV